MRSRTLRVEERGHELRKAVRDHELPVVERPDAVGRSLDKAVYLLAEVRAAASVSASSATGKRWQRTDGLLTEKVGARLLTEAYLPWLDDEQVAQRLGLVSALASMSTPSENQRPNDLLHRPGRPEHRGGQRAAAREGSASIREPVHEFHDVMAPAPAASRRTNRLDNRIRSRVVAEQSAR